MGDRSVLRLGLCASPVFMRRCPGTLHLRLQPCPRAPGRIEFGEGRAEVPGLEPRRQKSPSSDCAHVRAVQRTEDHSPMPVCQSSCVLVQSRSASRLLCGRVGERRKRPDARWAGRGGNSSCPASLLHSLRFPCLQPDYRTTAAEERMLALPQCYSRPTRLVCAQSAADARPHLSPSASGLRPHAPRQVALTL